MTQLDIKDSDTIESGTKDTMNQCMVKSYIFTKNSQFHIANLLECDLCDKDFTSIGIIPGKFCL